MFKVAKIHPDAKVPVRAKRGDAGADLTSVANISIPAHGFGVVPTGIVIEIPSDCYARVAPRSGLAAKNGINVGAGVVDSTYRGEIKVVIFNHSELDFEVCVGHKIAQLIFERIYVPDELVEVSIDRLNPSNRDDKGFGSTGLTS